jgi:spore coat-associated protein N
MSTTRPSHEPSRDKDVAAASAEPERVGFGGLWKQRKWWLVGSLLLLLVAAAIVVASGAVFSSSTANPSNQFSAGILKQSNSKEHKAILTAEKMVPGDAATGRVTIRNTGDVKGVFTLKGGTPTDSPGANGGKLSSVLRLKVQEGTTTVVREQRFDAALSKSLGTFAPGQEHTYKFTVTFPDTGTPGSDTSNDNAFQGSKTVNTYTWTATSS